MKSIQKLFFSFFVFIGLFANAFGELNNQLKPSADSLDSVPAIINALIHLPHEIVIKLETELPKVIEASAKTPFANIFHGMLTLTKNIDMFKKMDEALDDFYDGSALIMQAANGSKKMVKRAVTEGSQMDYNSILDNLSNDGLDILKRPANINGKITVFKDTEELKDHLKTMTDVTVTMEHGMPVVTGKPKIA